MLTTETSSAGRQSVTAIFGHPQIIFRVTAFFGHLQIV